MTVAPQKTPPTLADYQAAEARLREARGEAVAGMKASQDEGDVAAGDAWASKLQKQFDDFKAFRERLPRDVLLSIHADRILESFTIEEEQGWKATLKRMCGRESMRTVCLVIPADVSDEDAMHALNGRFRELFSEKDRTAIYEPDIERILDAGNGSGQRFRGSRLIRLSGVVPGTTSMRRDQQAEVLKHKELTFPHPIELALAAAAYACRCGGDELFNKSWVRSSVSGIALGAIGGHSVVVDGYCVDSVFIGVAAWGTPSGLARNPR